LPLKHPSGEDIQYFRAEAEMFQWLEQLEIKHAEMHRTIAHFDFWSNAWLSRVQTEDNSRQDGYNARAVRQAAIFKGLADDARVSFRRVGHPAFVDLGSETLVSRVEKFRNEQLSWMSDLVSGKHITMI
jgi:hypothetical protein